MTPNTPETKDKLIINLDTLDTSYALDDEEYIRKDIIDNLEITIRQVVKDNSEAVKLYNDNHRYDDDDSDFYIPLAQHPCFFIHGERGSGKSTLLRGLSHRLTHNKRKSELRNLKLEGVSIQSLAKVDPTEFAEGESFFIYILSRIANKLNNINNHSYATYSDQSKTVHKDALKNIQDMSHGLKLLYDSRKSLQDSEDPSFFIEDSIAKCASSADLKKKFFELLEKLSSMCHCDAFLITIDDADLNFSKCNEIMEAVRKYMITPRVIFVFAGDMKLYSLVCRDSHLANFHTRSLKYDDARYAHRRELMNILEDQYMMKLFPVRNRTHLSGISYILRHNTSKDIFIKHDDRILPLNDYLFSCMRLLYPANERGDAYTLLSHISTRSILQLLKQWVQSVPYINSGQLYLEHRNLQAIYNALADSMQKTFTQALIHHRVDFIGIQDSNSDALFKAILNHISELGLLPGSSKLTTIIGSLGHRIVSLYLNVEAMRYLSSVYGTLSYFLFIYINVHYIKSKIHQNNNSISSNKSDVGREQIDNICCLSSEFNRSIGCPWHTAFCIKSENVNNHFICGKGIICISRFDDKNNRRKLGDFLNELMHSCEIDAPGSNIDSLYTVIQAIYHSICIISTDKGAAYYFSVYSLLKLITDLLLIENRFSSRELSAMLLDRTRIKAPFYSLKIDETYDSFNVKEAIINDLAPSQYFENCEKSIHYGYKNFRKELLKWVRDVKKTIVPVYPSYLDNMWHNYVERCDTIFSTLLGKNKKQVGIGTLFKNFLLQFEAAAKHNIRTNDKKDHPIYDCISSFPLWKALTDKKIEKLPLWEKLNSITIGPVEKNQSMQSPINLEKDKI